ncbi:hypothetical protein VO178_17475 [Lysinibacillus fusiformis]|uniref:hypothetical protein n=1 Tax=Lysinibacillus fusiformis TaxID=28031 RepID=UPI002D7940DD|nr:hypothetical protein [Lysinibacillus fusiformis]WRS97147.1 hypothetical protein VO178_17475 [Lysinibacillus fusiformis]
MKQAKKAIKKAILTTKKVVNKTKAAVTKAKQQVKAAVKQTKQVVKEKVLPVVKKAAQATTNAVKNAVKPKNMLNTLQVGLDIVGMVPVVGEVADGVNGIIYAARGDKVNAALSFGAMIPVVGNAATAGKWINKGAKTAKGISESAQKANKGFIGNVKDKVNKQVSNVKTQIQSKVDEIKQQLQSSQLEIVGVNVGRIKDTGTVGRNTTTPSPKPSNTQPSQNGSNKKPAEDKGTGNSIQYAESGGRNISPEQFFKEEAIAEEMYEKFRGLGTEDVNAIANNTGFSITRVQRIKDHVFNNSHIKDHGVGRFDPDYELAQAWQRLMDGKQVDSDIQLLHHEIFESKFEGIFQTNYRKAHDKTIESGRPWDWEKNYEE